MDDALFWHPKLLASAFAGYYLALFIILWCLIILDITDRTRQLRRN
jgi:hypothetical protein